MMAVASACVLAALGPFPAQSEAHIFATGFMSDSLMAWSAFAATLLIPYESMTDASSTRSSIARGILWGAIFSLGALTKASYLYFALLIIPVVFTIRLRHCGRRSAFVAVTAAGICWAPVAGYWLRYGFPALKNGWAASFGRDAALYYVPMRE